MANPTTYFGWVMPTATDLVTDLPADFNVFGQGVDTSMQDLLGGTTGQVLSKASNTNMDFTWIEQDDSTLAFNAQTGTTYTLVAADAANKLVTTSNASAVTVTVPPSVFTTGNVINLQSSLIKFNMLSKLFMLLKKSASVSTLVLLPPLTAQLTIQSNLFDLINFSNEE